MATTITGKGTGSVGALYLADLGYPMLPPENTPQQKFDELQDYLYRLVEALRWTLEHLDTSNFGPGTVIEKEKIVYVEGEGEVAEPSMVAFSMEVSGPAAIDVETAAADGNLDAELVMVGVTTEVHPNYDTTAETAAADGEVGGEVFVSDFSYTVS